MVVRSRLEKEMDKLALQLTSSLEHDVNIWYYDILVDVAHVLGLLKQNYLLEEEAAKIVAGLMEIAYEIEKSGKLPEKGEDIHEAIEARLTELVGEAGMKMHTARSRNDEVATCLRMFARNALLTLAETILELRKSLLSKAEENKDAIMPGFTHLQYAQPTKLSHHLIAFHDMFERTFERCLQAFERVNLCPLGAAAFASTSFKLDREYVSRLLGFDGIVENSEDAVSSRDFLIESLFVACDGLLTLSRLAEEVVLWASQFVNLPDEYASSSSIMPQKKNPDVAEIIRAKAGKLAGHLTAAMAIYKAMPLAYNRDFQEMNPLLYEGLKDACLSFRVMADMLEKIEFLVDVMEKKAGMGFASATHVAEMLAKKGIPFRKAHRIVGRLSSYYFSSDAGDERLNADRMYEKLVEIMKEYGEELIPDKEEFESWLDIKNVVESRETTGGTSSGEIERMLEIRKKKLERDMGIVEEKKKKIKEAIESMKKQAFDLIEKL